jgi:hypothetical protein
VYEVASKRMFNEPTIMDTIASVSKALQYYEHAGGFAPAVAAEAADAALMVPTAGDELAADAPVALPASESQEEPLSGPAEAAEAIAAAVTDAAGAVVEEVRLLPPRPVAANADEARASDEPAATDQEQVAPEGSARAASPEIQEVEGTGASSS